MQPFDAFEGLLKYLMDMRALSLDRPSQGTTADVAVTAKGGVPVTKTYFWSSVILYDHSANELFDNIL